MIKSRTKHHHTGHTAKKAKIYIQNLNAAHFKAGAVCKSVDDKRSGKRVIRSTPRESATRCLGRVRLGENGDRLYFAVRVRVKNPHYKGTGSVTGAGYHYAERWKVVYDKRTGKAFDARAHMTSVLRGLLS
jgi:hypothetical protein